MTGLRASRTLAGVAVGVLAAAGALDLAFGETVTILMRRHAPDEVAVWRRVLDDPNDDPAEIYGVPEPGRVRVLVVDRERLLVPREAPERTLLLVDRAAGERVLLGRTLWWVAGALAVVFLALAGASALLRRRKRYPASWRKTA